jgi:hypothetical protein
MVDSEKNARLGVVLEVLNNRTPKEGQPPGFEGILEGLQAIGVNPHDQLLRKLLIKQRESIARFLNQNRQEEQMKRWANCDLDCSHCSKGLF